VRHPVDTVRSLLGTGLFADDMAANPYALHARMHSPRAGMLAGHNPLHAAVEFWCDWNARCAAVADATVRLEDATAPEPAAKAWAVAVADALGLPFVSADDITAAIVVTPTNTNTRGPVPEVDPREVWNLIGRRAHAFGYGS
jgi:hypothetical protein